MAATPDMAATGTKWFDEHELEDIKVISNVGLDDDDVQALREIEGISAIEPRKTQDILFTNQDGVTIAVKVYAADDDDPLSQGIDRLKLSEGRLPENESECLVESTVSAIKPINVGDTRGPSAIFRFLRTLPQMLDILRDMEELCPGAIWLNYTNPMAMLCRALQGAEVQIFFIQKQDL